MITLYAPTDTGSITGLNGAQYPIQRGLVVVPRQDVEHLLTNGFSVASGQDYAVEAPAEEVKKPAKKAKQETTE